MVQNPLHGVERRGERKGGMETPPRRIHYMELKAGTPRMGWLMGGNCAQNPLHGVESPRNVVRPMYMDGLNPLHGVESTSIATLSLRLGTLDLNPLHGVERRIFILAGSSYLLSVFESITWS